MSGRIAPALAAALLSSAAAWSAPITFNTALPVREGGWVLREQAIYEKLTRDSGPGRRDLRVAGVVSVLGYGVTRDFALFGMLAWLDKRLEMGAGGAEARREAQGLGDLGLLGRYTVFERNAPGRTFRVAPFVGVKAPTGRRGARDRLGRLPPPLQSGSGSWDFVGGIVATWQTLDLQIDAQASYQAKGEARDFQAGDVARVDGSLQYRLWPRRLAGGVPAFLYGVLEANLVHAARDRIGGDRDADSGGTVLFVSPGLQYVTKKWIAEAGVQIPVAQALNGTALGHDYGVSAGLRINF